MTGRLDVAGKVAVVTGAASGIGRAVARSLAARGCDVAIADVNMAGLDETARLIGNRARVTTHHLDVADRAEVAAFPDGIAAVHGRVDILVNNAGVALGDTFDHASGDDFDWLMRINFDGVVQMTRAFLPLLRQRPAAQLVNLSSLFGLVAPPGQTAYAASKFAVRGFSNALRQELIAQKSPVRVTVVHPGGIATNIAESARMSANIAPELVAKQRARFERALRMPPERAGEIIVKAIERRAARVLVGNDAKLVSVVERMMPVGYWRLIERMMK